MSKELLGSGARRRFYKEREKKFPHFILIVHLFNLFFFYNAESFHRFAFHTFVIVAILQQMGQF